MYSSLAQAGLIVLGLFASNSLGFDGAVLQIVNHALVSTSLFLIAGMVERRTGTRGEFSLLGGMARGRPALATVIMAVGVISLAVPLSTTFAGEFLILAGVFQQGWIWAVIGAGAMVLAAMYMLRAISAVLHQDVGSAVSESALDLRLGELAIVVPLVLCLIGLSAWPNLDLEARAADARPRPALDAVRAMIVKPHVDWFALAPVARAARGVRPAADGRRVRAAARPQGDVRVRRVRRLRRVGHLGGVPRRPLADGDRARARRDVARPLGRARAGDARRLPAPSRCSSRTASGCATSTSPSTTRSSPPQAPAWRSSCRRGT